MRMCLAITLAALLAVPALAQQPRRGGGGGQVTKSILLANETVQKELKLTEEQTTKIKEFGEKRMKAFQELQGLGQDERRTKMEEMAKEGDKFVTETLKEDQTKRLDQLMVQVQGVFTAKVQEELKLKDDQKEKIKEIADQRQKDLAELRPAGGARPDADALKKMAALRKEATEKAMGILDDTQKKKYEEMTGKLVEINLQAFGGGGGNPKKKRDK